MKKVKNILFKMEIKGVGIVNYDGSEQRWVIKDTSLNHMKSIHNNVSYAKKRFYGTLEDTKFKLVISSDCLRHEMFKKDVPFHTPNVISNETILTSLIASPALLTRGYMLVSEETSYKRKSPLIITYAEQTNDSISYLENFSSSASKNTDKTKETADSTFFKKEVVGDVVYETNGFIDLMNLQFVSCDQIFDRLSFNSDLFDIYKKFLQTRIPSFDSELGYYQIKDSMIEIGEYGFKLSNDILVILVKDLFKRMISMNIQRKDAYAKTANLQYKLVYDVIEDTMESEDGWVTIKNESDINEISFDSEEFYVPVDAEKEKEKRELFQLIYDRKKEKKIAEREEKKKNNPKVKVNRLVEDYKEQLNKVGDE
jgi:hypothetical protein